MTQSLTFIYKTFKHCPHTLTDIWMVKIRKNYYIYIDKIYLVFALKKFKIINSWNLYINTMSQFNNKI